MATQPQNLFGTPNLQVQPLRAFPAPDGIRTGKLAQFGADTVLPHLTPLAYDAGSLEWNVFDDLVSAIDQIDGFLWSPAESHTALLAGETIIQVFRAGSIDRNDVPIPTTASQSQSTVDAALIDPALRTKNIEVLGIAGVF
jgi:hypothetical protein